MDSEGSVLIENESLVVKVVVTQCDFLEHLASSG